MPDLVLLDVMLPKSSEFDLVPIVRRSRKVPIIFLSARGLQVDKLRGLEAGADDYITKPFDMQELLARIRAVLRRTAGVVDLIKLGGLTVDFTRRIATGPAGAIALTNREFEISEVSRRARQPHCAPRPAHPAGLGLDFTRHSKVG
jgi:two-component system, OmpR family, response regulator